MAKAKTMVREVMRPWPLAAGLLRDVTRPIFKAHERGLLVVLFFRLLDLGWTSPEDPDIADPDRDLPVDEGMTFHLTNHDRALIVGGDPVLMGTLRMTPKSLKLEVNSRERRDRLVGMLEQELTPLIQRTDEKSSDISQIPLHSPERGWLEPDEVLKGLIGKEMLASDPAPREPPSEEVQEALRQASLEAIQAYYRTWPDQSVPALGNITPREAVRTERGRKAVEDLIRSFESYGFDSDQPQPDFNELRRDLGLGPPSRPAGPRRG